MRRARARRYRNQPHPAHRGQSLSPAGHHAPRAHGNAGARGLCRARRRQRSGRPRHIVRTRLGHAGTSDRSAPRARADEARRPARFGPMEDDLVRAARQGSLRWRRPVRRRPCGRPARRARREDADRRKQPGVRPQVQSTAVHRGQQRRPHTADQALCQPVVRHGESGQSRLVLRPDLPRGHGRGDGRHQGHAARQARFRTLPLRPVHRHRARAIGQPVPTPGPPVGRGAHA